MPVRCLNISPAKCGVVPTPAEAKFNLPGFALPYATRSGNVLTGRSGETTRTSGDELTIETTCSWVNRLYGMLGCRVGFDHDGRVHQNDRVAIGCGAGDRVGADNAACAGPV